jgi:hypothetical protein
LKVSKTLNVEKYLKNYFAGIEDEVLIEMAYHFPSEFKKMCILMSLDFQLEEESYEKKNSYNRGDVC